MYADCVAEAVAQFQLAGSNPNNGVTPGEAFASFWNAKKKTLTIMQQIYIDDAKWKSQEKLMKLTIDPRH